MQLDEIYIQLPRMQCKSDNMVCAEILDYFLQIKMSKYTLE